MLRLALAICLVAAMPSVGSAAADPPAQTVPAPDAPVNQAPTIQTAPEVPPPQPQLTPPPVPGELVVPPVPVQPAAQYFIAVGGQPVGPFALEDLAQRIRAGAVKRGDLVWKSGTAEWKAVETFTELQEALAALPPDVPASEQYRNYLVGTWQVSWTTPQGIAKTLTISFRDDGTYNAVTASEYAGVTTSVPASGKWTVAALDEGRFTLTYKTPGVPNFTVTYRVVDANSVEDTDSGTVSYRIGR